MEIQQLTNWQVTLSIQEEFILHNHQKYSEEQELTLPLTYPKFW